MRSHEFREMTRRVRSQYAFVMPSAVMKVNGQTTSVCTCANRDWTSQATMKVQKLPMGETPSMITPSPRSLRLVYRHRHVFATLVFVVYVFCIKLHLVLSMLVPPRCAVRFGMCLPC